MTGALGARCEADVRRFDVPVLDVVLFEILEGEEEVVAEALGVVEADGALLTDQLGEGAWILGLVSPRTPLLRRRQIQEETLAGTHAAHPVTLNDMLVAEPVQDRGLGDEALRATLVVGDLEGEVFVSAAHVEDARGGPGAEETFDDEAPGELVALFGRGGIDGFVLIDGGARGDVHMMVVE